MTYKFGYIKYIRGIFMGSGIFILILLCSKLSGLDKEISFIISTLLILFAPVEIYRQVYSWTSAYVNYLIPTIIFLIILLILNKYKDKDYEIENKDVFFIFILGISCQLFMENITIYNFIFSLVLFILSRFKYKKTLKISRSLFLSNLIGMIIMFSCRGYRQVNTDGYRNININSLYNIIHTVIDNGLGMTKFIMFDNAILVSIVLILCLFIIKKYNCKNKIFIYCIPILIFYILFIKYTFGIKCIDIYQFSKIIRIIKYSLDCITTFNSMLILAYTIYKCIKDKDLKNKLWFYYISIIIVSMPMIIVYPIGTRCFFICYVFLVIICMKIMGYTFKYNIINIKMNKLNIIANILVIAIILNKYYIFNDINNEFQKIISYTEEQMINKKDSILLPRFTYENYTHGDISSFIGFLYYYNTPNDIKFKTIDRNEWENLLNSK